ncbi:MAG: hypothetical protein IBJ04_05255 [Hydrogenophaga sp.]|jgi:hypothetical protein|uniref:Uncharacterized protein n=1 Tax=Hydrogenophaga crocea TaxID=2716225 RepID=A0A6G8IMX1_9BURK|nr:MULTISPECIES: hypothetical protein [Hydrogenophaga]MBL0943716.1 hypothetical protein [Hydrogenophaga sp.]QIM54562.1 hypothetical protein G9Q37_21530 [Hydrogenophaga crocea]
MFPKKHLLIAAALTGLAFGAQAKLPAPAPLTPEAAAKADEAKAKAAHTAKVDAFKLCKSMDKAAANYFKTTAGAGKQPSANAPACTDPGPFAYVPPKPAEAAGAHSPAAPAVSPPSQQAPAGAPTPKKP